ncbi:MAG: hypothetical protein AB3K77_12305 [Methanosarcinaceae archaeon]|uniref:hypothetical protein n=1 Tax=Methanosarcina sp. MTP4 TaxID=1434100 RepID=UPI000AE93AD7|nr:hypothetical protein [Methanosarcina sp. MTP4]
MIILCKIYSPKRENKKVIKENYKNAGNNFGYIFVLKKQCERFEEGFAACHVGLMQMVNCRETAKP